MPQDGLVPFLIDWGSSPHPADSAPSGVALVALRAEHPDPPGVGEALSTLNLHLDVAVGAMPMLIATLRTSTGVVDLR